MCFNFHSTFFFLPPAPAKITSAAAAMSLLSFDASSMEADKIYEFTLVVSKQTRTASTSVMVTALNGDPPKVGFMFPIDLMHMMSDEWGALT